MLDAQVGGAVSALFDKKERLTNGLEKLRVTHVADLANATLKTIKAVEDMFHKESETFGFTEEHVEEIMDAVRRLRDD